MKMYVGTVTVDVLFLREADHCCRVWDSALAVSSLHWTELSETLKSLSSLAEDFQREGKVDFVGFVN